MGKNIRILKLAKNWIDANPDVSDEDKLLFKQFVDCLIMEVRERRIARFSDLVDFLKSKADSRIDANEQLTPAQKLFLKTQIHVVANRLKQEYRRTFCPKRFLHRR